MNGISRLSFDRVKNETERDTSSLHDGSANVRAGFRRRLICHATLILNAPAARTSALGGAERRGGGGQAPNARRGWGPGPIAIRYFSFAKG